MSSTLQTGTLPRTPDTKSYPRQDTVDDWRVPLLCRDLQDPRNVDKQKLVGGFKDFLMFSTWGTWSNLTNIFQTGWNHQLENPVGFRDE